MAFCAEKKEKPCFGTCGDKCAIRKNCCSESAPKKKKSKKNKNKVEEEPKKNKQKISGADLDEMKKSTSFMEKNFADTFAIVSEKIDNLPNGGEKQEFIKWLVDAKKKIKNELSFENFKDIVRMHNMMIVYQLLAFLNDYFLDKKQQGMNSMDYRFYHHYTMTKKILSTSPYLNEYMWMMIEKKFLSLLRYIESNGNEEKKLSIPKNITGLDPLVLIGKIFIHDQSIIRSECLSHVGGNLDCSNLINPKLKCNHKAIMKCSQKACPPPCRNLVKSKYVCGHSVYRECHEVEAARLRKEDESELPCSYARVWRE